MDGTWKGSNLSGFLLSDDGSGDGSYMNWGGGEGYEEITIKQFIKNTMKKYTIDDLLDKKLNIAVHLKSIGEFNKIKQYCRSICYYDETFTFYLTSRPGRKSDPYDSCYINICFEDIDFNDEIIGYKLNDLGKTIDKDVLDSLSGGNWWKEYADNNLKSLGYNFIKSKAGQGINALYLKAGVLDIWFEPVYKTTEKIKIGIYEVKFREGGITVGCGSYTISEIEQVREVLMMDNVSKIEFAGIVITLNQIIQILNRLK